MLLSPIFCWALDKVIHAEYAVVCVLAEDDIGSEEWKQYCTSGGQCRFQINFGLVLLNYGICLKWDGKSDYYPKWMRQKCFAPCNCERRFFYLNGLTTGTEHTQKKIKIIHYSCGAKLKTEKCTTDHVHLKNKKGKMLTSGHYC